jgi:hypothetical protein
MTLLLSFTDAVRKTGVIPLVLRETAGTLPLAEALGPVIVALLAGLPVVRASARSDEPRLAGGGTIGDLLAGSGVLVWGSGCAAERHILTDSHIAATRGPFSRAALEGSVPGNAIFGDPAWLISRFYRPETEKRWDLGVVMDEDIPGLADTLAAAGVKLIVARTSPDPASVRATLDEILACRRLLTGGLSGTIVGESYGIPSLPLVSGPSAGRPGPRRVPVFPESFLSRDIADLYAGLRLSSLPVFVVESIAHIDVERVIRAIDTTWNPVWMREDDLIESFPLETGASPSLKGNDLFGAAGIRTVQTNPGPAAPNRPNAESLQDWVDRHGVVPLGWAATSSKAPYPNLGDALSAVMTAAIAGLPAQRRNFDDKGERLVAVGTIGHGQRNGVVHLWGTGLDATRNAFDPSLKRFAIPPGTNLVAHAMRGRNSAARLRELGVAVPHAYGDPVWFLPKLLAGQPVERQYELGIVLHITELTEATPTAGPRPEYRRYQIPPSLAGVVRIINTYTENDTASLLARANDIRSCKRIVSTSFHGLVIAECFGIPNAWFSTHPGEGMLLDVDDEDQQIDHRIRDWHSGTGSQRVLTFGAERHVPARWDQVFRFIDRMWEPMEIDAAPLFGAFPLRPAVSLSDTAWTLDPAIADAMRF